MSRLKVLSVASEIYPLIKTGGLADVTGALPKVLAAEGVNMRTIVPGYPAVLDALEEAQEVTVLPGLFGTARLMAGKAQGLSLFVLDAPYLYGRPGNPYAGPDGADWPDNAYRFGALGKVAAEIGLGLLPGFVPDVVHMHDWQAGLTAAYMYYSGKAAPGMVMTVHNLAFQGQFPAELVMPLGLPPASFAWDGVEHYGSVGFLKAGLQLADRITTVSPTYATEIMQTENGVGFDGLLRARAAHVSGILNGLDTAVWDPAKDPVLTRNFDASHLEGRTANKVFLRSELRLNQETGALLVGVVSRFTGQKGLDLLLEALPGLVGDGMQFAVVGSGEPELEAKFLEAAEAYPGRVGVRIGHDEVLAHRIQSGADVLLVPSRFEPCGLTQLAALRYGAVPVVARVGGLCDTVIDANEMALAAGVATGMQFFPVTTSSLSLALERAARLFRDRPLWQTMQKNGMASDVSWSRPANRYASLYLELCRSKAAAAASGGGRGNVVGIKSAGSDRVEGKAATAGTMGAEAAKSIGAGIASAGFGGARDKAASIETASSEVRTGEGAKGVGAGVASTGFGGAKDKAASVEAASAGAGKDEVAKGIGAGVAPTGFGGAKDKAASVEAASAGAGKDEVAKGIGAGVAPTGLGGAKVKAASVEAASAGAGKDEDAKGIGADVASASLGNAKDKAVSRDAGSSEARKGEPPKGIDADLAFIGFGRARDKTASVEEASSEAGEGEEEIVEPGGGGSGESKAAAPGGAGTSAGEADKVVSIACRDA
jgi:starch synthase